MYVFMDEYGQEILGKVFKDEQGVLMQWDCCKMNWEYCLYSVFFFYFFCGFVILCLVFNLLRFFYDFL